MVYYSVNGCRNIEIITATGGERADFDINEGDVLVLKEWDHETKDYTGRKLEKKVGYVGKWKIDDLMQFWPREEIEAKGIQVISLK